ncbi:MAG: flagellar brake protein [Lachnospiraceae bacterium]|nr:flagellar brake protein [Candidatus Merdinaster equi]
MLSTYVAPGMKLELVSINNSLKDNVSVKKYNSSVYEILSDEQLEVTMPMEQTKLILLSVDERYEVFFYTKKGLFQCTCRISDRYKRDNVYILVLDLMTNLRKFQRREYFRFSCAIDMTSRPLEAYEVAEYERSGNVTLAELPMKQSVIVDISGGGIRFIAAQKYNADSLILICFRLGVNGIQKEYNLIGKLLRVSELENKPGVYEHRLQYDNLKAEDREEIIRYIFEEERKKRQNSK